MYVDENDEIVSKLEKEPVVEKRVKAFLSKVKHQETDFEDIAQRSALQTFGEEYFFKAQRISDYRALVGSADAVIVTIPFDLLATTLSTFEMFYDDVKQAIENKHAQQKLWLQKIDLKKSVAPVIKTLKSSTSIDAEIFKKSIMAKEDTSARKTHASKLLQ